MKNFYFINSTLLRPQPAMVAFGILRGSLKKQTVLQVFCLLLLSLNCYGQDAALSVTFQSARTGNWGDIGTWVYKNSNGNGTTAADRLPSSTDNVEILGNHIITVNSTTAACSLLVVESARDNGQRAGFGTLIIETDKVLSINSFSTNTNSVTNSLPKAAVNLQTSGELKVSGANGLSSLTSANYTFAPNSSVTYNGNAAQTMANLSYQNLTLSGSGIKTPVARTATTADPSTGFRIAGNLQTNNGTTFDALSLSHTIAGNLLNDGTIMAGSGTINLGGAFTNTGAFNKGTGTFNYIGADQTITGVSYYNLTFSGSGSKTPASGLLVGNNLSIVSGTTFNAVSGTHVITNNISNAGTIAAGSSTIQIGGSFTNTDAARFDKGTGTVEFNGNTQTIPPLSYHNLLLSRASGTTDVTKTADGAIYVGGVFTVNPGALFAHNNSAFFYNGTVDQNITPVVYYNLTLAGGVGTRQYAVNNLTVRNNFQVYAGATFGTTGNFLHSVTGKVQNDGTINTTSSSFTNQFEVGGDFTNNGTFNAKNVTHTISGNWLNAGTFNSDASTIVLNGPSKTITTATNGIGTFKNLTVSNGTSAMVTDVTVSGELRVEGTVLQTGSNTMYLGSSATFNSIETSGAHIKGTIQTTRSLTAGTGEVFGNIGLRLTDIPSNISSVTVKRVTGTPFISNSNESVMRQFHITAAGGTVSGLGTANLEMRFPGYELNGGLGTTSYDIYRQDLNGLVEKLTASVPIAAEVYNYKLDKAQKYGMYTLSSNMAPLPVELAWFKAQRQGQGVLLTWETASEKENKGFEVQLSTDGKRFSNLDFVESKVVNSAVKQRYSYTDNATLASGTRYYRLAQVDLDGTTTYSNIKAVSLEAGPVAVKAYPNPFAEGQQVAVQLAPGTDRQVSLVLTNAMGQVVMQQQAQVEEGYYNLEVDVTAAKATGMYLLSVVDGGSKHTFKLIKR